MTDSDAGYASAVGQTREEVVEQLREEGKDDFAEWIHGPKRLNEFETGDFIELMRDAWVVQLVGDGETIQFTKSVSGDLIKCQDGDGDGEFGRPFGAYVPEFGDYLFSGMYRIELLFPENSEFEVANAAN